jgi:hypothetical protein
MPMSDAFRDARERVAAYENLISQVQSAISSRPAPAAPTAGRVAPRDQRAANRAAVLAWARAPWAITVPGTHSSGIGYDELLAILYAQGRPFIEQNAALRRYVEIELLTAFESRPSVPTRAQLQAAIEAAVRQRFSDRILRGVRDVRVKALLAATVAKKRARGAINPALPGYDTGELQRRVAEATRVRVAL